MTFPPPEPLVLWRFVNGRQEAYCVLQQHPSDGLEVRYIFNGAELIGVVSQDIEEIQQRAQQWRMRLVAQGWSEGHRRPDVRTVRFRRAGAKA
jgi:hypothetical protein